MNNQANRTAKRNNASQIYRYTNLFRYVRNWWLHFALKFGANKGGEVIFEGQNGISYRVPVEMYHLFKEIILDDCYLRGLPEFESENITILDIGANIGLFSLFMISRFPAARVYAYEPMPPNFDYLTENVERNRATGITLENKAVHKVIGKQTLHYHLKRPYPTAASLVLSESATKSIEVDCVTLAEIIESRGLEKLDLLKLDCEGSEFGIIYDTPAFYFDRISRMTLEYHENGDTRNNGADLEEYVRSLGYQTAVGGKSMMWAWK